MAELAHVAEKKKLILIDHTEYDVAELEVQEQQLTADAKGHKRKLDAVVAKFELAAEERKRKLDVDLTTRLTTACPGFTWSRRSLGVLPALNQLTIVAC